MGKMVSVRMPESELTDLKTVAEFDGKAVAEEIREAVKLLVEARREDPAFLERVRAVMDRGRTLLRKADLSGEVAAALPDIAPAVPAAKAKAKPADKVERSKTRPAGRAHAAYARTAR